MIRPFTCVCMVLAAGSGLYLYQQKHQAQMLDREITSIVRATEAANQRAGVLQAEWTLENNPERLAELADRFLALKTVAPGQFTSLADLDSRLPAVRAPEPGPSGAETDTDAETPAAAPAPPAEQPTAESPKAEPPPVEVARPDKIEAPPHREVRPAAPKLVATPSRPTPRKPPSVAVATVAPSRLASRETRSAINPDEIETLPHPIPRGVAGRYTPTRVAAPMPVVGSVLGMTRTDLAPPVPFAPMPTVSHGGG